MALDLYAGGLLPEDRYEAWAVERREELRQLYLALLVEVSGMYEDAEDFESAVEALRRAVSEEPVREEAHRGLMRLYARKLSFNTGASESFWMGRSGRSPMLRASDSTRIPWPAAFRESVRPSPSLPRSRSGAQVATTTCHSLPVPSLEDRPS